MAFTSRTFELLNGLRASGKYIFYKERRSEFEIHLIEPFRNLVSYRIRPSLSDVILESLETKKRIFGQIHKNDFGQGGAYDFYWAAFYPHRAARRQEDAQLLVFLEADYLEFGFFFGWYVDEEREEQLRENSRLIQKSPELFRNMLAFLESKVPGNNFVIRDREYSASDYTVNTDGLISYRDGIFSWKLFFEQLALAPTSEIGGFSPMMVIPSSEILKLPEEQLGSRIANTFKGIFPVMLLAISADPRQMVADYIGA